MPAGGEDAPDPEEKYLAATQAHLFDSNFEKEAVKSARRNYPRKKPVDPLDIDPLTGEESDSVRRRVMGFGFGFEKVFATTSIKLPISAYTIFVELHAAHNHEVFSRCFNGMHTLFDLRKWIYEKMLIPSGAYDLSYAEPGKAALTDQLRLLTTQDSLDARTLATTRAVHRMYKGIPGVHSIGDIGVTRLYLRLKCRTCGELLNNLQTCRKIKTLGNVDPMPDTSLIIPTKDMGGSNEARKSKVKGADDDRGPRRMTLSRESADLGSGFEARVPGKDPNIEDVWYAPDQKKHCLFHNRGYEYFEAARTHGGAAELARIYISCGKEPSKKLKLQVTPLSKREGAKISY